MLWITYFLALLHFFIVLHTSSCLVFIIKISLSIEKFLKIFLCTQLFIPSILDFPVYHCFPEKSFLLLTHLLPTNLNSFLPSFLIYFEPSILNCKLWSDSPHLSISSLWILVYSFCQASLFAISLLTMTLLLLKFPLFPPHSLLKVLRCSKPFGISVDPNLNSRHPCFLSTHSRLTFILFFFSFFIKKTLSDSTVPSVYSLYPSLGPIAGGTACLLTGANFETNSTFCNFISSDNNSHLIRGMDATSTSVICESPPSASKSVFVEVITQQGRSSSKSKLIFLYSGTLYFLMFIMDPVTRDAYFPAIEIVASIQPSNGPADGNTIVHVDGIGFMNSVSLTCQFGYELVSARWVTDSRIVCLSPPRTPGTEVVVKVSNNGFEFSSSFAVFIYQGILKFLQLHRLKL
jgi:hypothetical protein